MKTICIYHSVDLDGWMSAAIVKHFFRKNDPTEVIYFLGWQYGEEIPDLTKYDQVIMCDISFPAEKMYKIVDRIGNNLVWIDHHISAIKDFDVWNQSYGAHYLEGLRDSKYAACELTWKYFFSERPMPEIVRLLGRYDCFGHKGTDEEKKVLEFQYGARQVISNYEEAYSWLITSINSITNKESSTAKSNIEFILDKGKSIYQYLCTEAKQIYKNGFEIKFQLYPDPKDPNNLEPPRRNGWKKFICINRERFNPINFGINYHKDGYDGCACFWYQSGQWHFSLYNDNGLVDCSVIAKQYGGGGHSSASGFICSNETFLNIVKR